MKVLLGGLRQRFRRTSLYEPWRRHRERQQSAAFNRVLDSYLLPNMYARYSLSETKAMLRAKQGARRPFLGEDGKPHIVAFGAQDWEQYGLWPTLERISHFNLFNYGEVEARTGRRPGLVLRQQLTEKFLAYVETLDRSKPVNACFFYADSAYISPELLKGLARLGIWTIIMGLDDKHRFYERNQYGMQIGQITIYQHCDLAWTTWKSGADIIAKIRATPWYAPPGADPEFFHPVECDRDIDVVFVGQAYGIRFELVRFLQQRGFRVEAFGSGWPNGFVGFEELVRLFSRAKIVLGVGGVQNTVKIQHLKGRDFEVPMCRAVYLTSFNPELSDWYEIGKEVLCYSSFESCVEVLAWVLSRPDKQKAIREAALRRSLNSHTWEMRLKQLMSLFTVNNS